MEIAKLTEKIKRNQKKTNLNPFLNRLETVFKYRILPEPVVFRRLAF